jgi:hypothetical protein
MVPVQHIPSWLYVLENSIFAEYRCKGYLKYFFFSFFIHNYYNNYIINNKSDEIKILKIRMAVRHCQWRVAKTSLAVTSLLVSFYFSMF